MLKPTDVIPHLGKPELHWKPGHSAHALATTWWRHNELPPAVRGLLESHPAVRGAELIDAVLERKTDLRDGVRGQTQTDLLAILGIGSKLAVAAVEGKVDETFGPLVCDWLTADLGKQTRLAGLVKLLGMSGHDISTLRYQLFHRTAAAIYEAERYRAGTALLLVHSFSAKRCGWSDFQAFVQAIGLTDSPAPGAIFGPKRVAKVDLYAGWIADQLPVPAASPE